MLRTKVVVIDETQCSGSHLKTGVLVTETQFNGMQGVSLNHTMNYLMFTMLSQEKNDTVQW